MQKTATASEKNTNATTVRSNAPAEPFMMRKRISSTTFVVNVHFSKSNNETMEDKLLRLMEREANDIA